MSTLILVVFFFLFVTSFRIIITLREYQLKLKAILSRSSAFIHFCAVENTVFLGTKYGPLSNFDAFVPFAFSGNFL